MPYSESIGFIANLEDSLDIDMVTYVVAHEMGHQWWAHQVIGADMQGGTMLSETFAQYSALMIMEKLYGRERMSRFLKYELDRYLMGRSSEIRGENPLMLVENQPYIHYQKGSLVMYAMRDYLSADTVNQSLKKLVNTYAYKNPPFPTTHFFVDDLLSRTPDSLKQFVNDQFASITLYDNRMKEANATKTSDGKYEITMTFECKKLYADSIGNERPAKLNDYIEIGCFDKAISDKENYGKSIWRKKIKVKEGINTFSVKIDQLPEKAALDPLFVLVDRIPSDNSKKISLKN
jgi:aminopeptidase N